MLASYHRLEYPSPYCKDLLDKDDDWQALVAAAEECQIAPLEPSGLHESNTGKLSVHQHTIQGRRPHVFMM